NYKAEYGRALGAVVELTSRSGTNDLHGTAFEFLRNDKVDSRSFFDGNRPAYRRNQFGGVLGGPIVKDKAFFFGSYEALRERQTTFNREFVPTRQALASAIPEMAPYVALYPTPQVDLGGGVGTYQFTFPGSVNDRLFNGRVDYQYSDNVSYFARYSIDN